ncbi:hypothetical protein HQN90_14440 [Paenibacillus alba]|uniref:hypothetical protein n=1 Tax=Paenibacillus alba TaxID=1197127 RepID=UPI00156441B4|nr:hypothetical protein [Paenibacillus alba]NQX67317.1 hypothetical protein [Paenibacillus alba]
MKLGKAISLITLFFALTGTACTYQNSEKKVLNTTSQIQETSLNIKTDEKKTNSQIPDESTSKTDEIFFGSWIVKGVLASASISTHDNADIQYLEGKKINYSAETASFDENILKNPYYKMTVVAKERFSSINGVDFEELGINAKSVTWIDVYRDPNYSDYWPGVGKNNIGGSFMIKDKDTLIVSKGGDFFEISRVEPK